MQKKLKSCFICGPTDHLQAGCPSAWWNKKKIAKLSTQHESPTQQAPKVKAPVPIPAPAEKSTVPDEAPAKEVVTVDPPINADNQANTQALITLDTDLGKRTEQTPTNDEETLESSNEDTDDGMEDEDITWSDDEDDTQDVDMLEAAKEATAKDIPIDEVVKELKRKKILQRRKQLRKTKKLNSVKATDKDLVGKSTRSRTGGSAFSKKQSTTKSSPI
jgi:hypothetical protein